MNENANSTRIFYRIDFWNEDEANGCTPSGNNNDDLALVVLIAPSPCCSACFAPVEAIWRRNANKKERRIPIGQERTNGKPNRTSGANEADEMSKNLARQRKYVPKVFVENSVNAAFCARTCTQLFQLTPRISWRHVSLPSAAELRSPCQRTIQGQNEGLRAILSHRPTRDEPRVSFFSQGQN